MSLRHRPSLAVVFAVISLVPVGAARERRQASAAPPAPPVVTAVANDNRTPAGMLKDGVLTLHLVALVARWQPEGQGPQRPRPRRPDVRRGRQSASDTGPARQGA